MLRVLMFLVLPFLGAPDVEVRDAAEVAMENFVEWSDDGSVVKQGRLDPDPEIACRCRHVFSLYQTLPPLDMCLDAIDFDKDYPELWDRAYQGNPTGLDGPAYINLLLYEGDVDKHEVQKFIEKAKQRRLDRDTEYHGQGESECHNGNG